MISDSELTRAVRVLVVDDSVVFRTQIASALNGIPGIEVAGTAASGSIALQKLQQMSIDAVTIDMEMPEMDGIGLIRAIRAKGFPVKTIVFSSQTTKGAERALEALSEGANDIVAKPTVEYGGDPSASIRDALAPKILQFLGQPPPQRIVHPEVKPTQPSVSSHRWINIENFQPSVIVIASSTGGPSALEEVFTKVAKPPKVPLLIAQHMPPVFTGILASRIQQLSGIPTCEAKQGEPVRAGHIYIAPGDFHMLLSGSPDQPEISLSKSPPRNSVRPAADYLFESAVNLYGSSVLGIVMTGMGEDGLVGSRAIKHAGGAIYIQSKESCVVFGMPGAVFSEGAYDKMGDLVDLTRFLSKYTT